MTQVLVHHLTPETKLFVLSLGLSADLQSVCPSRALNHFVLTLLLVSWGRHFPCFTPALESKDLRTVLRLSLHRPSAER
jgi:hypothetical protein